jgi:hypothetical protein
VAGQRMDKSGWRSSQSPLRMCARQRSSTVILAMRWRRSGPHTSPPLPASHALGNEEERLRSALGRSGLARPLQSAQGRGGAQRYVTKAAKDAILARSNGPATALQEHQLLSSNAGRPALLCEAIDWFLCYNVGKEVFPPGKPASHHRVGWARNPGVASQEVALEPICCDQYPSIDVCDGSCGIASAREALSMMLF